jgi:2-hydroxychromene-2-carboxylate isomerase
MLALFAAVLEYWFDFSCPYAYLASTQIEAIARRTGAELSPRPLLLGGVFKALEVPQNLAGTLGPEKAKHNMNDMHRFARLFGVPLSMPSGHPRRTVDALRALLAAGEPFMPLAHRFFRAYWVEGIDLSSKEGVRSVLSNAGLDAARIMARAESEEIKSDLRTRTDQAIARGVFGVPAIFVNGELYWGQDRLDYVEEALGGKPERLAPCGGEKLAAVDFFFDYSSPFSYIASERVDAMLGDAARWVPLLLGGLFKAIGTPNVPLFTQSPSKRRHTDADLLRQARRAEVPFSWPTRFPMNTVLALRVTLAADAIERGTNAPSGNGLAMGAKTRALIRHIFRAYWVEDLDISSEKPLAVFIEDVGLDARAVLTLAGDPSTKDALRAATDGAVALGVFGAPTFVVHPGGREPSLFWGADRLDLATRAARGDERVY